MAGLNDNFLRPYQGYAGITSYQFIGTSNYNALQASIRRRLSRGLQFGASYTFSKALGAASSDGEGVSSYMSPRVRNYGPLSFDRTQVMSIHYLYDPRLSRAASRRHRGRLRAGPRASARTAPHPHRTPCRLTAD